MHLLITYGCEAHAYMFHEASKALHKSGGRLISLYGTTEAGPLTQLDGRRLDTDEYKEKYVRYYSVTV